MLLPSTVSSSFINIFILFFSFRSLPSTSSPVMIQNLNCDGVSALSECTFTFGTCDVSEEVAVSCCEFSTDHLYCMCSTTGISTSHRTTCTFDNIQLL